MRHTINCQRTHFSSIANEMGRIAVTPDTSTALSPPQASGSFMTAGTLFHACKR